MKQANEIAPKIKATGLGLWLEKEKTLIIGDLHLGYEEMLNRQGVMMPRINFEEIKERLEKILEKAKPEKIIVNGDLKHEFGTISQQEWKEVLDIIEFLQAHCKQLVLVRGNHDTILGPIALLKRIEIKKEGFFLEKSKVFVTHGHEIFRGKEFENAKTIVIGNEHPAVSLSEGTKKETYKCFLKGKFEGKELIAMPSFSSIAYGTDVLQGERVSPFLPEDLSEFELWAVEDKVYYFGKIKNIEGEHNG